MRSQIISSALVLLMAAALLYVFSNGPLQEIERSALERIVNQNAKDFFEGPVLIERVHIDREFKLRVYGISGNFKTRQGPVPIEAVSFVSVEPLYHLIQAKPVRFVFKGLRPQSSKQPGIKGECLVRAGKAWRFELNADLNETVLEDWSWLDPQDLQGASGAVKGSFNFSQAADKDPAFDMKLEAPQPGGMIQAKFFDLFLPYLPKSAYKKTVEKLAKKGDKLVRYQTADLEIQMPQSDRMKILLHILVLDYNLKLTLNADIRTDSKNALFKVAQIMGMIEVKTS